jgi:hypothetical protein
VHVAGFVELTLEQGANFNTVLDLKDSSGGILNLSGYSVLAQMRKSYYSNTSTSFTMTISDAAAGQITMAMSAANTASVTPGRYVYDILLTSGSGIKTRIIEGIITVMPSVTR